MKNKIAVCILLLLCLTLMAMDGAGGYCRSINDCCYVRCEEQYQCGVDYCLCKDKAGNITRELTCS